LHRFNRTQLQREGGIERESRERKKERERERKLKGLSHIPSNTKANNKSTLAELEQMRRTGKRLVRSKTKCTF
jgi:hypothetical protein